MEMNWNCLAERKPEQEGWYLTTFDGEICGEKGTLITGMNHWNGKFFDEADGEEAPVIAWMPMPEPPTEEDFIPSYPTLDAAEEDLSGKLGKYESKVVKVGEQKYLIGATILCYEDKIYGEAEELLRFFNSLLGKTNIEPETDDCAELRDVIFEHLCEKNDVIFNTLHDTF